MLTECYGVGSIRTETQHLQFADGVILLLLIGQLEGFFLHLKEFYLTPSSPTEMVSFWGLPPWVFFWGGRVGDRFMALA